MAAAAVEGNMRKFHFKHKKEVAYKKNKNETSEAGPPKSTFKSGVCASIQKGRPSLSPQQSSPLKFGVAPSTSPAGSNLKKLKAVEDVPLTLKYLQKKRMLVLRGSYLVGLLSQIRFDLIMVYQGICKAL